MKKAGLIFGLGGAAIIAIGLVFHFKTQITKLKGMCYKIKSFQIVSLKLDNFKFFLNTLVKNGSDVDFDIVIYDFDVLLVGKHISHISSDVQQTVSANSVSELKLLIDFSPKEKFSSADILRLAEYATLKQDKFVITLVGKITIKSSFITKTVPVEMTFSLKEILESKNSTETCDI